MQRERERDREEICHRGTMIVRRRNFRERERGGGAAISFPLQPVFKQQKENEKNILK
jgi:hypothetical protein